MIEQPNDMTLAEEPVDQPTGQDNLGAMNLENSNLIPVPEEMAANLNPGQEVKGTVIDKEGTLFIQLLPESPASGYTGKEPEDMTMNSEDALGKYMIGPKNPPATQ